MDWFNILIVFIICHIISATKVVEEDEKKIIAMKGEFDVDEDRNIEITNLGNVHIYNRCAGDKQENIIIPNSYTYTVDIGIHKYYPDKKTWNEAREYCELEGAHLAIINSDAEERFLHRLRNHKGQTWLGFHDLFKKGQWVTVLDKPLLYMHWGPGNPDNLNTEFCGSLENYGINNLECQTKIGFFCEIDM